MLCEMQLIKVLLVVLCVSCVKALQDKTKTKHNEKLKQTSKINDSLSYTSRGVFCLFYYISIIGQFSIMDITEAA